MAGGGQILTLGEVSLTLKSLESSLMEHDPEATLPPMLRKTMEYVDRFKKGDEVATLLQMREYIRVTDPYADRWMTCLFLEPAIAMVSHSMKLRRYAI